MWSIKVCFVVIACIDVLYVQALPYNIEVTGVDSDYSPGSFEALKCPENEFLNHEKACEATCENPISSLTCAGKKVIACQCDDGYLRNSSGACVKADKCEYGMPQNGEKTLFASQADGNVLTMNGKPNDELENIHPDNHGDDELEQLEADLYIRNVIDSLIDDVRNADADESFEYPNYMSEKEPEELKEEPNKGLPYVDLEQWVPQIF